MFIGCGPTYHALHNCKVTSFLQRKSQRPYITKKLGEVITISEDWRGKNFLGGRLKPQRLTFTRDHHMKES